MLMKFRTSLNANQHTTENSQQHIFPFDIVEKVSRLQTFEEATTHVLQHVSQTQRPFIISFINAHGFNLCFSNREFYKALLESDILFRDGKGMEILYKSAGVHPGVNFCGTDFIPVLLSKLMGKPLAVIGTEYPYWAEASNALTRAGHNIVLAESGFLTFDAYLPLIKKTRPEVILLGLGMPNQERLSIQLRGSLDYPCLIINGGAIIDLLGKRFTRAPRQIRQLGFEWLYRLMQEPGRLHSRYLRGNYVFLRKVYQMAGTIKSITLDKEGIKNIRLLRHEKS